MKFVIFTIFIMIAMAMAAPQADQKTFARPSCIAMTLPCRQTSQCCRGLMCQPHANICVPQPNPDENDTRPEGPKMPY